MGKEQADFWDRKGQTDCWAIIRRVKLELGYDDDMVLDLGFSSPTEIPIAQLCLTCRHAGSIANFGGKH